LEVSAAPNKVTAMIAMKIRSIPPICWTDGFSERRRTPQRIVSTGWSKIAKEVCAAGSLGRAYVMATHPITWQETARRTSQPCPGQLIEKSIGSIASLDRGSIPARRRPVAAPAVASSCRLTDGAWMRFENLYRIRNEE